MTETLANGYSYESTRQELSNEYQHDRVSMVFEHICILVLWMKVASALEGLTVPLKYCSVLLVLVLVLALYHYTLNGIKQCLSQDLETRCLKLAVVKFMGIQISKGDQNILLFQP